jgi:AcrR family transcriptional regulator
MRRKDQRARREQLIEAARAVMAERGAVGIRVKDVADRAAVSPSSLLYYYPDFEELLFAVARDAIDRYTEQRAAAVRDEPDPLGRLRTAIRLGVPTGPGDEESRILDELDAYTGTSAGFAALTTSFFDRQVSLYESIFEYGQAAGKFRLEAAPHDLARQMIGLEDGLGLQVVIGHPLVDCAEAERLLLSFALRSAGVAGVAGGS